MITTKKGKFRSFAEGSYRFFFTHVVVDPRLSCSDMICGEFTRDFSAFHTHMKQSTINEQYSTHKHTYYTQKLSFFPVKNIYKILTLQKTRALRTDIHNFIHAIMIQYNIYNVNKY